MTTAELKKLIAAQQQNGRLLLTGMALQSASIQQLLQTHLPSAQLVITAFQIAEKAASVLVTGQTTYRNAASASVEAEFLPVGATVEAIITIHPDIQSGNRVAWQFAQSFPELRQTLFDQLALAEPQFILASREEGTAGASTHLLPGLSFRGVLTIPAFLQPLSWLFKGSTEVSLNGSIALIENLPEMRLTAAAIPGIQLGFLNLAVKLRVQTTVLPSDESGGQALVIPFLDLVSDIRFGTGASAKDIQITTQIPAGTPGLLSFVADLDDIGFSDLVELTSLANGVDLKKIPAEIKLADRLKLSHMSFIVSPRDRTLVSVSLEVHSTEPWKIVENLLELELVKIAFTVNDPLHLREVHVHIFGEIKISDILLEAGIVLPEKTLSARLARGRTINLSGLMQKVLPHVPLPDFKITELVAQANPTTGAFLFQFEITDNWEIMRFGGGQALALTELFMSIERLGSGQNPTGMMSGIISIAQQEFMVSANHPQAGAGWLFQGNSSAQDLPVGTFMSNLANSFGGVTLPEAITSLKIKNLAASFNTQSKDFTFDCAGQFAIDHISFEAALAIAIKRQVQPQLADTFDKSFSGKLTLRPNAQQALDFLLRFDTKSNGKNFIAAYHDQNGMSIGIDELIQKVFNLQTHTGLSFTLKDALFAYQSNNTTSKYLFGLDIEGGLNLAELKLPDLPLVGAIFPPDQTLKLAFQVLAPSAPFNAQELAALSALNSGGLAFPKQDLNNVALSTSLRIGNESKLLNLPIALNTQAGAPANGLTTGNAQTSAAQPSAASGTSNAGVQWLNVQKTFGPVQVQRIGLKYADSKVTGLIDAALAVGGLTISLDGLSVTSALQPLQPEFALHGLGIDYRNGPLEIGGSFLKDTFQDEHGVAYTAYAGMAVIRTETLSLSAIGAYAKKDGNASLFIYAVLNTPLGGPAFFFVTGLAAGFGYNRGLRKPTIEQVASFPLVAEAVQGSAAALPSDATQRRDTLSTELRKLNDFIPPSVGENFLAVGLRFTSFELLDTFAVLIVKFGARFEIDVLGLSTLIVPTAAAGNAVSPLAEAQLAIIAAFIPDEGFLGVQGQLTANSFVLARACHLTGGFAFFSWFDGPHAGDFVMTLGGYHTKFQPPAHYPTVPRLGLNWQVNDNLSIKAQGYFALCAHALMAGGMLEASWQSDNVVAYFKAGADFLVAWQPYHYDIELYVAMSAEVIIHFLGTHHLSFDAGADLHLWGPEFAGEAHIRVKVLFFHVSFDVEFGGRASLPEPIDWATFKKSFLPKREAMCGITISRGLIKESEDGRWIINPKDFVLITNSALPATAANGPLNNATRNANTRIAAMPMGITAGNAASALNSLHQVTITRDEDATKTNLVGSDFALTPVLKAVPAAMWGEPKLTTLFGKEYLQPAEVNGPRFVENTLAGFEVRCGKTLAPSATHWIDPAKLRDAADVVDDAFSWQDFASNDAQGPDAWRAASNTILRNAKRADLLTALGVNAAEFDFGENVFDEVWVEA